MTVPSDRLARSRRAGSASRVEAASIPSSKIAPQGPLQADAAPIRVFLAPGRLGSRGLRYNVHLGSPDGERIVANSLDATFAACRVLVARGVSGPLEVWHVGSTFAAMHIRDLVAAARLTVRESGSRGPTLIRYRPRSGSTAPVRRSRKQHPGAQSENSG